MATFKLWLDIRSMRKDGTYPVRIAFTHHARTSYISTDVSVPKDQWDAKMQKVVKNPRKALLNNYLNQRLTTAHTELLKMVETDNLRGMSSIDIKNRLQEVLRPTDETPKGAFYKFYLKNIETKKADNTKRLYRDTLNRINEFCQSEGVDYQTLSFDMINRDWLKRFDAYLTPQSPSQNARNIHLRNIRAVFNDAIDDELTSLYPFRKFPIKAQETEKRSLTVEQLREFFNWKEFHYNQEQYLDMFKLVFFTIGINSVDLFQLQKKDYRNGRIKYRRAKTGRLYDIKVEPEAKEILDRYKGGGEYLLPVMDYYKNYRDYASRANDNLQRIGTWTKIAGRGGKWQVKALHDDITIYWARHTWATLAAELDIPKETISAALGHGTKTVTDVYIDFDYKKVEAANRKVIDYVLQKGEYAPKTAEI